MKATAIGLGLWLSVAVAAGCAHQAPAQRPAPLAPPTAAEIPPADQIPGAFTVRQKLTAKSAQGGGSFEAVLQKSPGKLTLVGITPYGARAFLLQQTGGDVQFTSYLPRDLPFPPTFVLLDIHRVMGDWLGGAPPAGDGQRAERRDGEQIDERWRGGRLVERTFTRAAADPPGAITITYVGDGPAGLAAHVTLVNARLGYQITIDSLSM
jgi:hypothetical protein